METHLFSFRFPIILNQTLEIGSSIAYNHFYSID